jgi:hypothetical protein
MPGIHTPGHTMPPLMELEQVRLVFSFSNMQIQGQHASISRPNFVIFSVVRDHGSRLAALAGAAKGYVCLARS